MKNQAKNYLVNLIIPAVVFAFVTGALTAITITLYKVCAKYVIGFSQACYGYLRTHLYFIPVILIVLVGISFLFSFLYKKIPNLKGGGIPTTIGILRGIITFKWLRNLLGVFITSLTTFLIGVPLGNEGPSVQMGTAIGRGSIYFAKKHRAWDRYTMTGGACAGFAVATGAPVSGILFAIEEAHERISPMIVIVSSISVMVAYLISGVLAPVFNVSVLLFPKFEIATLSIAQVWIPLVVGVFSGLFAVIFLKYYKILFSFFDKKLKKIPHSIKIFAVLSLTLIAGLFSFSFISTGHGLIENLFSKNIAIYMLVLLLLVRSTLTLIANSNSITGGIFLPILAIGATFSTILAKGALALGLGEYYTAILAFGITACIAGIMKMPITAIVFVIETLSLYDNIIFVIIVSALSYAITEIFGVKSINEKVLDNRVKEFNQGKSVKVIDTFVTVQKNSFAIGKQIRDIFWPANLFVLSIKRNENSGAEVDEHGKKSIKEGDILHVRYSTYDENQTRAELKAIVGEQEYFEQEAEKV